MKRVKSKILVIICAAVLCVAAAVGISFIGRSSTAEASTYSVSSFSNLSSYVSSYKKTSSSNQNTIKLTANLTATSTITLEEGYYITIDLNGYNIALSSTNKLFDVYGTLTIKDSTASFSKSSSSSKGSDSLKSSSNKYTATFYASETNGKYSKITYTAGSIYGGGSNSSNVSPIYVGAGGTFNLYGGIFHSGSYSYGGAVNIRGSKSTTTTFNMYGGLIYGNTLMHYGGAVYGSYGSINMYGGGMVNNTSSDSGGAIYSTSTSTIKFGYVDGKNSAQDFDRAYLVGNTADQGGAVYQNNDPYFYYYDGVVVSDNSATTSGGAVWANGIGYIYGGDFVRNTAPDGTYYRASNKTLTVSGGNFFYNSVTSGGGVVYAVSSSTVDISGGDFESNSAGSGGVVYLAGTSKLNISDGTFKGNTASSYGGVIYSGENSTITVTGGTFSGNSSSSYAGVLYMLGGTATISGADFSGNMAVRGGVTYTKSGDYEAVVKISDSTFTGNTASSYGGVFYPTGSSKLYLTNVSITGSSSQYGAVLYSNNASSYASFDNVEITDSTSTSKYGAVYVFCETHLSGKVVIKGNTYNGAANNVHIYSGHYLILDGPLSPGSYVGLTMASSTQTQITEAETSTSYYSQSAAYFHLDSESNLYPSAKKQNYVALTDSDDATVESEYADSTTGYHDSLSDAFAAASAFSGETKMTLLVDTYEDSTITLAEGCVVTLDLAGHNVTWMGATQSNFFCIDGDFTLDDSLATGGTASDTLGCGVTAVDVKTDGFENTMYRTVYGVTAGDGTTSYYYYRSGAVMGGKATASGSGSDARGGAFYISSTGSMTMYGGTIYGNTGTYGGGVHSFGTFTMYGGAISENVSQNSSSNHNGAGLFNDDGGTAYLYGGVIYGNSASGSGYGGGVENSGTLAMEKLDDNTSDKVGLGPVISGNFANKYGGGIYGTGTLYVYGGYVTLNTSSSYGGGIYSTGETCVSGAYVTGNTGSYGGGMYVTGALAVSNSYIVGNEATSNYAGGIYASGAAEVAGTLFALNTAVKYGGAMYSSGTLTVTDCTFSGNTMTSSSGYGGGLYAAGSSVITGTKFERNVSAGSGGALCIVNAVTSELAGVTFENNSAAYGGALYVGSSGPTVSMTNVTMTGNTAGMYGGAIYFYNSASRVEFCSGKICGNSAGSLGGAVYLNAKATLALYGGEICCNTAGVCGGGVYSFSSNPVIIGGMVEVSGNTQGAENSASNIYLVSGSLVTVEADFTGKVSFLTEEDPDVVIGGDAMDAEVFLSISERLSADDARVLCIGLNSDGYLSLFLEHSFSISVGETETGYKAVKFCGHCHVSDEDSNLTVTYEADEDGNLVMIVSDGTDTVSQVLEGGALVTDADGTQTWYSELDKAVAAVSAGGSMVLNQDAEELELELSGSVTVDLNGHTVGSVTVSGSYSTTLTIEDSSMGAGTVTGDLSASGSAAIAVKGGTYYEDVSGLLASGDDGETYYVLSTTDENGNAVSKVYFEADMPSFAAVYVETGEGDTPTRIYYESVKDARAANTGDYTITLIRNVEEDFDIDLNGSVTVDLAGFTLTAYINITAGDGTETGKLTVTDTLKTGSLAGTIKVSGESEDTSAGSEDKTNSYADTVFVAATAVSSDLTVDLTELYSAAADSHVEYFFSLVTDADGNTSYQITTGHVCSYIFPELFIGIDGSLKAYLRCSCGEAVRGADGGDYVFDFSSESAGVVSVVDDEAAHTVTYTVSGWTPSDPSDSGKTYSNVQDATLSFEYVVKINTYDGDGNLTGTIYLDEDHLDCLDDILGAHTDDTAGNYAEVVAGTAVASLTDGDGKTTYYTSLQAALDAASSGGTVTLLSDVAEDVVISEGGVTLDLNGHGVDGDIAATSGSLTIEDGSSGGTGSVSGNLTGDITVAGGSYSFDVGEYLAEGCALYVTADGDGGLVYTVIDAEDGVSGGATVAASVTYELDGKEVTIYYESLSDAVENLPDGAVLTILADSTDGSLDVTIDAEGVTIDLNGHSLDANIAVAEGASLTIADGGSDDEGSTGTGSLNGKISGDGDVTVTGGTYSQNIADCVKEGCSVYVTYDVDGNMIYEVLISAGTEDSGFSPAASAEYTRGDGTTITIYYDSIADAVANVSDGDVITVLKDITSKDLVFATTSDTAVNVTLDLNGHAINGGIEAGYNVNLTITDGSEEKTGAVTGSLAETGSGTITVEGGTYGEDVSSHMDAKKSDVVLVAEYDEETGAYTYTVVSGAELAASVQVTYTDEAGNKKTIYFESIDDAAAYACDADCVGEGTAVTITLLCDVESTEGLEITSGNVTIDLNGHKLSGDVSVSADAADGTPLTVTGEGTTTSDVSEYVGDGYAVIKNTDGTYSVVKESDALASAAAVVEDADGVKTYYASVDDAISSLSDGGTLTLLSDAVLTSDAAITASVRVDLNGNTLTGNLTISGATEITDGAGGGELAGTVVASSGTLTITGGTFTDTDIKNDVAEGCVAVENPDGSFTVIGEDSVASVAEAYYDEGKGNITYYSSVEEALAYAGENGGKVVLCSDASAGVVDIYTEVEIDLAGFTLDAEIIIHADENADCGDACGTLTVSNGAADGTVGSLTGTITVVGVQDYTNEDETNNPYADTLLIKDGVTPGADLWVDVYTSLGTEVAYTFGEYFDENGDGTGEYGIGREHLHNYNIENWTFGADGTATLYFSCACGDYCLNGDGNLMVYDAEVEVEYLGDGVYSFTASVEIDGVTYEACTEKSIVALVTDAAGNAYYAESLQEAADIAATLVGSAVTVLQDTDEEVSFRGEVTIDLGDCSVGGISAEDGSYVVITGDGYVGTLTSEGDAVLKVRGGTYDGTCLEELMSSTDFYNGYAVFVNGDGTLSVVDEDVARINAAASVTDSDGNVIYYESMEAALAALGDGDTLTLWAAVDEDTVIDIAATGVTLDLNDCDVYGTVQVEGGASAAIVGEGYVDYVRTAEGGELVIRGGTYDSESYAEDFVDTENCDIIVSGGGTYTVVGKGEAEDSASAVVHITGDDGEEYDIYFENIQNAADYAVSVGGTLTLISDYTGGLYIDGDLDIDLNGCTLDGGLTVTDGAAATVKDGVGGGAVTGALSVSDGSTLAVYGGTYSDASVEDYLPTGEEETYVAVENSDGTYTVMTKAEALESCGAYVVFTDGDGKEYTRYFSSGEDAIYAAVTEGGSVTLQSDADLSDLVIELGELVIETHVEIDLNGYTLKGDITILTSDDEDASVRGELWISDSSNGAGALEGTLTVKGAGDAENEENPYEDTLVLDGVAINDRLTLDLSDIQPEYGGTDSYVLSVSEEDGTYRISDKHDHAYDIPVWTFGEDGSVTLRFMCVCGEFETDADGNEISYTADASDVTVYENGDGTVTVEATIYVDGVEYTCSQTENVAAYVDDADGNRTYFADMDEALEYVLENGGKITLNDDVSDADIVVPEGTDVTINLNGHALEGSLSAGSGASLTVVGEGTLEAALDADGVLEIIGVDFTLTEDFAGSGEIHVEDSVVDLGGNTLSGVTEISGDVTFTGSEGSTIELAGDVENGGTIYIDGDVALDLAGHDLSSDIEVGSGASLTVLDSAGSGRGQIEGTVTVDEGGSLTLCDDTYFGEELSLVYSEGYVIQSATDESGATYYELVTEEDHLKRGHGFDTLVSGVFDPADLSLTMTYECACGEILTRTVYLSSDEYTAEVVDGKIVVTYAKNGVVTAPNDSVYSFDVSGTIVLDDMFVEGEDGCGFVYEEVVSANCYNTGVDRYTYGYGNGVVVEVESPVTHRGLVAKHDDATGVDYYLCKICGKYVTDEHSTALYETADQLIEDLGFVTGFESKKEEELSRLEEMYESILGELDESMPGYDGILAALDELYGELREAVENMDYEAQTSSTYEQRQAYYQELFDGIEKMVDDAVTEMQMRSEIEQVRAVLSDLYDGMEEEGVYVSDDMFALRTAIDAILSDLDSMTIEDYRNLDAGYIVETCVSVAYSGADTVRRFVVDTTEGSGTSGRVSSSGGMSGTTELVITELDEVDYVVSDDSVLIYMNDGSYSDVELRAMVDGKNIAAAYDIALYDTALSSIVYVFNGQYTVRIALTDELAALDGLQIVYVGDNGKVEIYATTVTDGCIEFTTTHFSTYLLLADIAEPLVATSGDTVTDLTNIIRIVFWVDIGLIALAIILLIALLARTDRGRKQSGKVASVGVFALLLAVVPAGGVVSLVILGVIGVGCLAADIAFICLLSSNRGDNEG